MKPRSPKKITRNMAKEQPFMKVGKPVTNKTAMNWPKPEPKHQPFSKSKSNNKS